MFRRLSQLPEDQACPFRRTLPWPLRVTLAALGTGLLALLVVAALLEPDPYGKGYGTHQQLGLPPCTFTTVFGFRCPSCGMTTSWSYAVRGRIPSALGANSGGTLLAILAMVAGPWSLATAVRGRPLGRGVTDRALVVGALCVLAVTAVDWIVRLAMEY